MSENLEDSHFTPTGKIRNLSLDEKIQYCRFNEGDQCSHFKEKRKRADCMDCISVLSIWEPNLFFVARNCGSITCYLGEQKIGDRYYDYWLSWNDAPNWVRNIIKELVVLSVILGIDMTPPIRGHFIQIEDGYYLALAE